MTRDMQLHRDALRMVLARLEGETESVVGIASRYTTNVDVARLEVELVDLACILATRIAHGSRQRAAASARQALRATAWPAN